MIHHTWSRAASRCLVRERRPPLAEPPFSASMRSSHTPVEKVCTVRMRLASVLSFEYLSHQDLSLACRKTTISRTNLPAFLLFRCRRDVLR